MNLDPFPSQSAITIAANRLRSAHEQALLPVSVFLPHAIESSLSNSPDWQMVVRRSDPRHDPPFHRAWVAELRSVKPEDGTHQVSHWVTSATPTGAQAALAFRLQQQEQLHRHSPPHSATYSEITRVPPFSFNKVQLQNLWSQLPADSGFCLPLPISLDVAHEQEAVMCKNYPDAAYAYDRKWLPFVTKAWDESTGLVNTLKLWHANHMDRCQAMLLSLMPMVMLSFLRQHLGDHGVGHEDRKTAADLLAHEEKD